MGKDSMDKSSCLQDIQLKWRSEHPKIAYGTAKEAARALQETKHSNKGTRYEAANHYLSVYYDGDHNCFHIGHHK